MSSYGRLDSFSIEELEAEIKHRQSIRPKIKENINWAPVLAFMESTVYQVGEGFSLPPDFDQDLMETVLESMYGKEVFKWWNAKLRTQ